MRYVILLSCLALLGCGPTTPAPVIDAPVSESPAFEPNYTVILAESRLGFSAEQEGEPFTGQFTDFDADILFDPDALGDAKVRVVVPLASLTAGNSDRDSSAPSKVWFDVKTFPVATFESNAIRIDGDGYVADGTLAIKGQALPFSLPFTLEDAGGQTIMRATTVIDRTLWNIGDAPWDTDQYVSRAVNLDIVVVAEQQL